MESNSSNEATANDAKALELMKELKHLQTSSELIETLNQLITDYKKHPEDMPHLIRHLEALKEFALKTGCFCGSKPKQCSVKRVCNIIVTSETYGANADVIQTLRTHNLELIHRIEGYDVVLIFCVVNSRVGSDVEDAMGRIPEDAPVVLVVMHHKVKDDFLIDGPQWSSKYKNVKCHVDMVFHQSKPALFTCDTNKQAMEKLTKYMKDLKLKA
ncbi:hypothetical protein NQD34_018402 [Periophthalmus magnuspinnatus]|nr:hypothetical protein NQD34_018402 [Periophthalmus magnuspinnatus]